MGFGLLVSLLVAFGCLFGVLHASPGDADPLYRRCVEQCEKTGVFGDHTLQHCQHCQFSFIDVLINLSWYTKGPLEFWKYLKCKSDCQYHCMMQRENERKKLGLAPVRYHGKWPFKHEFFLQEPFSAVISTSIFFLHFFGWLTFIILERYNLPLRNTNQRTYYEYTKLWHIYAILVINSWCWSFIFRILDFDLIEKLDCSSAVAVIGYSLILCLLRIFEVKNEAARVMFAAPILAFLTTHIFYLNFYEMDYAWNKQVCLVMEISQILMWTIWGVLTRHPSRFKLWGAMYGCAITMLFDYHPSFLSHVDDPVLLHSTTVPFVYLWWDFIKDDARFRTSELLKKTK